MVKISDIIRGKGAKEPEEKPHRAEEKKEERMEYGVSENKASTELYAGMVTLVKEAIEIIENKGEGIEGGEVKQAVEEMAGQLMAEDAALLKLAVQPSEKADYIYKHLVNTSILAVKIGQGLNYNKIKLVDLGMAALFHDEKYISKIVILNKLTQERKRDDAERFKEIIKVIDIYAGLIHPRSYRKEVNSYEVMKTIIESTKYFLDYEVVKLLLEKISLYPLGSRVLLNTNEIGRVVDISKNMPLRPKVEVELGVEGIKLKTPKLVDLANRPQVYIKKIAAEEKTDKS